MTGYLVPSRLLDRGNDRELALATALGVTPGGVVDHPRFFSGFLARPEVVAAGLLALADVAAARYFDPNFSLLALDPVITAGGTMLRAESFSACNGVYARLDLGGDSFDTGEIGFGTTNVDLNDPLRSALAALRRTELVHLEVGADGINVATPEQAHVERKVKLPDRWVRGLAETPVIAAAMRHVATLARPQATSLLVGLPGGSPGPTLHLGPTHGGLRPVPRTAAGAVRLAGSGRLTAYRRLLRFFTRLDIYAHDGGASAWVFAIPGGALTLMLSPEPYRGFSGEGGLLHDLARAGRATDQDDVEGELVPLLAWQQQLDPDELATHAGVPVTAVRHGLGVVAASGRLGFDLTAGTYFHRELPLDATRAEKDNPRLRAARALVAEGAVVATAGGWRVTGSGSMHSIRGDASRPTCTCTWWAKYAGSRGPCKHVLAAQLLTGR
ncbi:SWIM zinc finger domain-containing protein [Georgenia sp. EYE_87]|uniref:SWIM zinc finger family protein n=1 Tax=Georgenia sp. EYE_87 TaxID=2853448 RepID=UPI0020044AF3|nr:SWIM zinc finger family protein [Georgenia sp. EYE_87]MCK6208928.1 SWIM zinc finger domain-containing protein [Georgenia sp. EYE_87]